MTISTINSESISEIKSRCIEIIDGFAHRDAIRQEDMRAWLSEVVGKHGQAAIWHATRAGGFGGSDIGVLARNFMGHRADHMNSAHDIVASKLLRSVPSEDSGDLRRGHENEASHAVKYYAKYSASRDVGAFDMLSKSQGLRQWMRYSPDDVVIIPSSTPNPSLAGRNIRRLLIDYKAPRKVEDDESISFQYACQLHQGAMICAKNGIHLDGLMLSQFDWAGWTLKDDNVSYDGELSKLILKSGDHYFDYVMRGELPAYIMTPKFDREQEFIDKYGKQAQRLAHISAAGKAFTDEADLLGAELKNNFKDVRLSGTKMQLGDLGITCVSLIDHEKINSLLDQTEIAEIRKKGSKPDFDTQAMALKLQSLGVDINQYRIDKIDGDKAYPVLIEKGFNPEQFMKEQIRFKVADHLKEAAKDLVRMSFPKEEVSETDQMDSTDSSVDQDVRNGQTTERQAQRTVMV